MTKASGKPGWGGWGVEGGGGGAGVDLLRHLRRYFDEWSKGRPYPVRHHRSVKDQNQPPN